jgi:glycerol-3-phosphate dehydrogenase
MDMSAKINSGVENEFKKNIAVIGAGSFGTAVAEIAARAGNNVRLFARNAEVVDHINENHRNPHYLTEFELSPGIVAVDTVEAALKDIDFVVLAIPTQLVSTHQYSITNTHKVTTYSL